MRLRYIEYCECMQYYNPLKSRLSLHSCGTEIEEVPQKWILSFSSTIQVLHNESIGITPVGPMWLRYIEYFERMQY